MIICQQLLVTVKTIIICSHICYALISWEWLYVWASSLYYLHFTPLDLLLFSHSVVSNFLRPPGLQHTKIPCLSHFPRVCSNSYPSNQWWHPTILTSVSFSCPQPFPAAGSFSVSHLFTSGDQNIGVSVSASVVPMNIQGWFPLRLTVPEMRGKIKSIYFKLIKMYCIKSQFYIFSDQLISIQSLSPVWLFATPWTAARQASLSISNSRTLLKLMSIESVFPSNHPLLLLPSIFPSIRVFYNESALHIR